MQSIAEQLLRQNLVTAEQAEKADGNRKVRRRRSAKKQKPGPDPKRVAASAAIESHRLTEDFSGEIRFAFTHRDRKKAELLVNIPTAARLGTGEFAIVEHKDGHVIVRKEAVTTIREADPEAVRYHAG